MMGYQPDVILAGRQINDGMGKFIAGVTIKKMIDADCKIKGSKVLVLGITFKENCGDTRNSKVIDVIEELQSFGITVLVYDPVANHHEVQREYGINLVELEQVNSIQAVIAAVPHASILAVRASAFSVKGDIGMPFIDVKSSFCRKELMDAGLSVWRL